MNLDCEHGRLWRFMMLFSDASLVSRSNPEHQQLKISSQDMEFDRLGHPNSLRIAYHQIGLSSVCLRYFLFNAH